MYIAGIRWARSRARVMLAVALMAVGAGAAVGPTLAINVSDAYTARVRSAETARWMRAHLSAPPLRRPAWRVITPGTAGYLLEIPKLHVRLVVHELEPAVFTGLNTPTLKRDGVGQLPYTAALRDVSPGAFGTAAITGHRTTSGAPFRHLDALVPDDVILIEQGSERQVWRVADTTTVAPSDLDAVRSVSGVQRLVLLACTPPFSDRERIIIDAVPVRGPLAYAHAGVHP